MPAYEYTALNGAGKTCKGALEGDNARHARQQLRNQGLTPLVVEEIGQRAVRAKGSIAVNDSVPVNGGANAAPLPRAAMMSLGAADLALLTRQLATLTRSGLALEEALQVMAKQTGKAKARRLLMAVRSRILEGHALADALAEFPRVFSGMYRATVAAGEQSGHLDLVLERLAEYAENHRMMRQKTMLALFYPLLLSSLAALIVTGLLAYVVPKVAQVFVNLHQDLPWLTRALIALGNFFQHWGWALLLGLILLAVVWHQAMRNPTARFAFDRLLLRLPLVQALVRGAETARLARTLAILLQSGVPLVDALRMAAGVVGNLPMRAAVNDTVQRVREGTSLHQALEQTRLFPPMAVYLIASGEASGNLEGMLDRAAVYQEQELEGLIGIFLGLFEPLLILFMGGVVLLIVLAILLPVFELNQLVK